MERLPHEWHFVGNISVCKHCHHAERVIEAVRNEECPVRLRHALAANDHPATGNTRPTLHVTNWSSTRLHGPGPRLTIMALPRAWERGDGTVEMLVPVAADLRAVQAGTLSMDDYRALFEARMERALQEGSLQPRVGLAYDPSHRLAAASGAAATANAARFAVEDGSTLCCACSRQAALEDHCHRAWAARVLARAGWNVILDGAPVPPLPVEAA